MIELSLWSKSSFGKSNFYGQLLIDLAGFNWNKYDGLEQMWRLRPRAPLNPFIVPYKGDIEIELCFVPPQIERDTTKEGFIKISITSAKNLIPVNHNIR